MQVPNSLRLLAALVLVTLGTLTAVRPSSAAIPPTITYTGQLLISGSPVSGTYDFQFGLYTAASGGTQVDSTLTVTSVRVADGVYYVQLTFPSTAFNGNPLYLQTAYGVHPASSYTYSTPRSLLPTSGYADYATLAGSTSTLHGVYVSGTVPTDKQVLTYSAPLKEWLPQTASVPAPLTLSGSSSSAIVSGTNSGTGSGVTGQNSGSGDFGFLGGIEPITGFSLPVGVYGSDTSSGIGVFGNSTNDAGVLGNAINSTGVAGYSSSSNGYDANGSGTGVIGQSGSGNGVVGQSGSGDGVYGYSSTGSAGYFSGNVTVTGNLNVTGSVSKGGGSFKIDSPLHPATEFLSHSFVESPDMMNIYNGNVHTDAHGLATVKMPRYFAALNQDFRYQLTVIGQFAQAIVATEIAGNQFIIKTDKPHVKVSWMVTGIRHDAWANAHRIPTEELKPVSQRGLYLNPVEQGQPVSLGISYAQQQKRQAKN